MKTTIQVLVAGQQQQGQLAGVVHTPSGCTSVAPCPLVVVVGDYDAEAHPTYDAGAKKLAGALPAIVVVFNLPGLGTGARKSEGDDDIGGPWQETAVQQLMHLLSARKEVDKKHTGYLTIGSGLIPVASALKRFATSTLKEVQFLLDVEGPTDRCAVSQAPADETKGIGPADGEGASPTACNFNGAATHAAVYPPAHDGRPTSIVCSLSAWPITKTGVACKDTAWWQAREPALTLKGISQRYQRLQFTHDHRLPSHWSSRIAIKSVVASTSKWVTLNNFQPCSTLPSDDDCAGVACWLEGPWGNGLPPAPYAAGALKPVSIDDLFTQVLPGYVKRLMDDKANPNCR
ncbi:MAG: hypothetical protein EXR79_00400 [Myxococcales bacterium]|nr:hypothetical protein [Myxococcales bacterium]